MFNQIILLESTISGTSGVAIAISPVPFLWEWVGRINIFSIWEVLVFVLAESH